MWWSLVVDLVEWRRRELQHFVECVRERQTPRVTGAQAKVALDVAFEIVRQIGEGR